MKSQIEKEILLEINYFKNGFFPKKLLHFEEVIIYLLRYISETLFIFMNIENIRFSILVSPSILHDNVLLFMPFILKYKILLDIL